MILDPRDAPVKYGLAAASGDSKAVADNWAEPAGGAPVLPRPLPPPPDTGGLLSVLRYSFHICLTERWAPLRLVAVFALLLVSRGVGECACPTAG